MNSMNLYEAIGELDAVYVEEALGFRRRRRAHMAGRRSLRGLRRGAGIRRIPLAARRTGRIRRSPACPDY